MRSHFSSGWMYQTLSKPNHYRSLLKPSPWQVQVSLPKCIANNNCLETSHFTMSQVNDLLFLRSAVVSCKYFALQSFLQWQLFTGILGSSFGTFTPLFKLSLFYFRRGTGLRALVQRWNVWWRSWRKTRMNIRASVRTQWRDTCLCKRNVSWKVCSFSLISKTQLITLVCGHCKKKRCCVVSCMVRSSLKVKCSVHENKPCSVFSK